MVKLVSAGHGGIDLEGRLTKSVEFNGTVDLDPHVIAECDGKYYLGMIKTPNADPKAKDRPVNGKMRLTLDGTKKDFGEFRIFDSIAALDAYLKQHAIDKRNTTEVDTKLALGQGALNAAYGMAILSRDFAKRGIDVHLATVFDDERIRERLPPELRREGRYKGTEKGRIITNVNISGLTEKLTFRAPSDKWDGFDNHNPVLDALSQEDVLLINSVKDEHLSRLLYRILREKRPTGYICATDSMVKSLGVKAVRKLAEQCEVYSAKIGEMGMLLEREVKAGNPLELRDAMLEVQAMMKPSQKRKPRIYLTDDANGAYVLDEKGELWYHPVAKGVPVENASGCGDAFLAVLSYFELLRAIGDKRYTTKEILIYAGIAGQIKAGLKTACGDGMANRQRINDFYGTYPDAQHVIKITPEGKTGRRLAA